MVAEFVCPDCGEGQNTCRCISTWDLKSIEERNEHRLMQMEIDAPAREGVKMMRRCHDQLAKMGKRR